jgi:pimeloyl-ACP methyl ester carboxylesterase
VDPPRTQYAKSDGVNVAYQVAGDGRFDVVLVPGSVSHIELGWRVPTWARILRGLAEISRLIVFDKRGTGMSDRLTESMTFEQRMDDIRAVMEAAGSERAALVGLSEGAPMSVLFAATYPERAAALVLYGGIARAAWASDYPYGQPPEHDGQTIDEEEARWGEPGYIEALVAEAAPGAADDELRAWTDVFRYSVSPGAVGQLNRLNRAIDVRPALAAIRVPTLVVHQTGDPWVSVDRGRHLADNIPGAAFLELPGEGHALAWENVDRFLGEVRTFLEQAWGGGWPEPSPIGFSRPCCSRTSSARPPGRSSSATGRGESSSRSTTSACGGSWRGSAGSNTTRQATASSPASTARRAPSVAPVPFATHSVSSTSTCDLGCTRANASFSTGRSRGSRSRSGRASPVGPNRARCSSPGR